MRTTSILTVLVLCLLSPSPRAATDEPAPKYDWAFFYYMAYDNNLEEYGALILDMLARGVVNEKTAVICVADLRDEDGMERHIFTNKRQYVVSLREEGSAEEEVLAAELRWFGENFPAKRYALVFLDHGGRLAQMSLDEHPGTKDGQHWLRLPEVATVIGKWRKKVEGEVELLFVQQCGKGTLENYYALKDCARVLMGSQTRIGAPNYYYTPVLRHVAAHPDTDGPKLAAEILRHEAETMFTTYTAVDGAALKDLPERLDAVLAPLLALEKPPAHALGKHAVTPCFDFDPDERFYDGIALLRALYRANGLEEAPVDAFADWFRKEVLVAHRVSERQKATAADWCGFSLFLPTRAAALTQYTDYTIYRETRLGDLLQDLLGVTPRPGR